MAEADSRVVVYAIPLSIEHINQIPFWNPFIKAAMDLEYKGKKIYQETKL